MRKERTVNVDEQIKHRPKRFNKPLVKVQKRMALRLKQAKPEFEEVDEVGDDEPQWITYQSDNPNMAVLKPLLKTAEAMVDPTKANAYYLRLPAAKKLAEALGEGWGIEAGRIARVLPFGFEFDYQHPDKSKRDELFARLRNGLEGMQKAAVANVKGIHFYTEGQKPDKLKAGWLYVSVPKQSTCFYKAGNFYGGNQMRGEQYKGDHNIYPARMRNGIAEEGGVYDFAFYSPQTIHIKQYQASYLLAYILLTAVRAGAQLAMAYEGGAKGLKVWLEEGVAEFGNQRKQSQEKEQANIDAQKKAIAQLAGQILEAQGKLDASEQMLEMLKRKLTTEELLKQLPTLEQVESINQDDPSVTEIKTKEITLHGVNLGPYLIQLHHETRRVVIKAKRAPEGVVHPNLWLDEKTGKWNWDLGGEELKQLIVHLAANKVHQAADIVLRSLLNAPADGEAGKRLEVMRKFLLEQENKPKRGRPKKEAAPEEPKEEPKKEEMPNDA